MKQLDFDRAFPQTPDCIHAAIEMGFRKGQKQMKIRNKIIGMSSIAAAIAIMIAVAAFAAGGLGTPPQPDVLAQPLITDIPKATEETNSTVKATNELLPGDAMVYTTASGKYYHLDEYCSGMEDALYLPMTKALEQGKGACPNCIPETSQLRDFSQNPLFVGEPEENAKEAEVENASQACTAHNDMEELDIVYISDTQIIHKYSTCRGKTFSQVAKAYTVYSEHEIKDYCTDCLIHGLLFCPVNEEAYDSKGILLQAEIGTEAREKLDTTVYYTSNGNYYHLEEDCSGMKGAKASTLENGITGRKQSCPVCFDTEAEIDLMQLPVPSENTDPVFLGTNNHYFHRNPNCFDLNFSMFFSKAEALHMGMRPCPNCLEEMADLTGVEKCYASDEDKYYHSISDCDAIKGTVSETYAPKVQAQGKFRCPKCARMSTHPTHENLDYFLHAFGRSFYELYEGYTYERTDKQGNTEIWYVSNGEQAFDACTLLTEDFNNNLYPQLRLRFTDKGSSLRFMEGTTGDMKKIYILAAKAAQEYCAENGIKDTKNHEWVGEIAVYLNDEGRMESCSMNIGFHDSFTLSWRIKDDGSIEQFEREEHWNFF